MSTVHVTCIWSLAVCGERLLLIHVPQRVAPSNTLPGVVAAAQLHTYMYIRTNYMYNLHTNVHVPKNLLWQNTHNIHLIVYMYTYTMCACTNGSSPPSILVSRGGGKGESFSGMTLYLCQSQCAHNTCQLFLWVVRVTQQTTARCLYMMRVVGYWTIPRSSRNSF